VDDKSNVDMTAGSGVIETNSAEWIQRFYLEDTVTVSQHTTGHDGTTVYYCDKNGLKWFINYKVEGVVRTTRTRKEVVMVKEIWRI